MLEQCLKYEICSKVNNKGAGVFIIDFEHILHITVVFPCWLAAHLGLCQKSMIKCFQKLSRQLHARS